MPTPSPFLLEDWKTACFSRISPSLTPNLVMFTDNQSPVNLLALDVKTGEVVASLPVLEEIDGPVSVENSAIVYDDGALDPSEEAKTIKLSVVLGR